MTRASTPQSTDRARRERSRSETRRRRVAFFVVMLLSAVSLVAAAQTKKPAARPAARPAAAPAKKPAGGAHKPPSTDEADAGVQAPLVGKETAEPVASTKDAGKGGSIVEQKTLDGGQRVFRFGEVEVEGRLKSPQIVYFLRRVRAEFAAGDLGHRSFMSELGETKNEPSF